MLMGQRPVIKKYYDALHKLYSDAVDFLYSYDEKLFFRNSKQQLKLRTPNDKQVFWGRDNGWVIGGLVRLIEYLPERPEERGVHKAI